jgi:hypothetical protein
LCETKIGVLAVLKRRILYPTLISPCVTPLRKYIFIFFRDLQSALFVLPVNESEKEITPEADMHGENKVVAQW